MIAAHKRAIVSFGTFEVDLDAGEIRKSGMRVRLQGQPFRVLAALLSRPGEVTTREELQQEIWGSNTTVDFERGIASAINKIRDALGDSAENPRYIETLAKRGYRFIAPVTVEPVPGSMPEPAPAREAPAAIVVAEPALRAQVLATPSSALTPVAAAEPHAIFVSPASRASRLRLRAVFLTAVLAAAGLGSLITYRVTNHAKPYRPPHIAQLTQSSVIYSGPPNDENLLSLVTDGPRIYTSVQADGRSQISSIDLSATQVQPINMPDELTSVSIADISRDGSRLIVRSRRSRESEQPLWIVPTAGSSALRVGEVLAHDATWMPGGGSILYAFGDELDVAQLDTGAVTNYVTLPGRAFWPRWSPDGATLRFTLLDPLNHTSTLWQLEAATRRFHRLEYPELAGLSLCCGSWTADGGTYVFQASDNGGSNIWAVGTGAHPRLTELTDGPLRYMFPLPGRDNRTLYFVGLEEPAGTRLYDAKSGLFVPAPPFLAQARRITYSRDGKWVAWTDIGGRLWRARAADGSGRLRLTEDNLDVFLAQWSPDSQQLVLMARRPGETWQIYMVSASGGATRRVLSDTRNLADPDWSADGKQIVFGREADLMGKESGPHNLQLLDVATHRTEAVPGSENLFSPRWSPDGRWLIALSLDQTRLLLYDRDDRSWKTLFVGGAADPVWSGDSKAVYFHAFLQPHSAIMRIGLDGKAQSVADLSRLGLPSVDTYFFSGVTPGGAPLIEPRIGAGNLYAVDLSSIR